MLPDRLHTFFSSLWGKLLLHLLFWMGVGAFLTLFFGHFAGNYHYTFMFVCLLVPIAVGTTYLINYFLVPRYLLHHRYGRFITYFIFTLVLSVWAEMLVMFWAFVALADYRYSNMNPLTGDVFLLAVGLYIVVFFSTSIKLLKHWYRGQQRIADLRSQQLEAALKLREAELKLLKGQIHPHFLFNTLNNLYGLALEKSADMPEAILRLSSLLDALLYRSQQSQIPVSTELKLIEDYLALERLRFEGRLSLSWQLEGEADHYAIAPFLLFPFIENAVKHGFSNSLLNLQLNVSVCLQHDQLSFVVINSRPPAATQKAVGGIGLKNVRKRLELLYPGRHTLNITAAETSYTVALVLQPSLISTPAHANA